MENNDVKSFEKFQESKHSLNQKENTELHSERSIDKYLLGNIKKLTRDDWPTLVILVSFLFFAPFLVTTLVFSNGHEGACFGCSILQNITGKPAENETQTLSPLARELKSLTMPVLSGLCLLYLGTIITSNTRYQDRYLVASRCIWVIFLITTLAIRLRLQ